jgi:hypothetical protein
MPIGTISGKDNFGANGIDDFVAYAAIGTGTPTFTSASTALANEVLRTNGNGGFSDVVVYSIVDKAGIDYRRRTKTFYRVFNLVAAFNITEYALFVGAAGGNASIVGRTRVDPNDEGSALFTLSADAGDQIQLIMQEIEDIPYELQAGSFAITGTPGNDSAGTYAVNKTYYSPQSGNDDLAAFRMFDPDGVGPNIGLIDSGGSSQTAPNVQPSVSSEFSATIQAYLNGNYYREKHYTFTTAQGNVTIYGFRCKAGVASGGFKAFFTNPTTLVKTNTQTLLVRFRTSWDWL